jgi:hypothetical protein
MISSHWHRIGCSRKVEASFRPDAIERNDLPQGLSAMGRIVARSAKIFIHHNVDE